MVNKCLWLGQSVFQRPHLPTTNSAAGQVNTRREKTFPFFLREKGGEGVGERGGSWESVVRET